MSRLIARILLAILILPFAALVYLPVVVWAMDTHIFDYGRRQIFSFGLAGVVAWAFMAAYWFFLWRTAVK